MPEPSPRPSPASRYARHSIAYLGANVAVKGVQYLTVIALGWWLPLSEFAHFTLYQSVLGFMGMFGSLGYHDAVTMLHHTLPAPARPAAYRALILIQSGLSAGLSALFAIVASKAGTGWLTPPLIDRVWLVAGIGFLFCFLEWPITYANLELRVGHSIIWEMARGFTPAVLALGAVWFLQADFATFLGGQAAGYLLAGLAGFVWVTHLGGPPPDRGFLRQAFHLAWPLMPRLLFIWILLLSDRLVVSRLGSLEQVALQGMARQWALIQFVIVVSLNRALTPNFLGLVRAWERGDDPTAAHTLQVLEANMVAIFLGTGTWLILALPLFLEHALPSRFAAGLDIMVVLTLGHTLDGFYHLYHNRLAARQRHIGLTVASGLAAVAGLLATWLAFPRYGLWGSALTISGSLVLRVLLAAWFAHHDAFPSHPWRCNFPDLLMTTLVIAAFAPVIGYIDLGPVGRWIALTAYTLGLVLRLRRTERKPVSPTLEAMTP